MYTTDMYEGILAETVTVPGANGDMINAFFARPLGPGPFPAMVLAHHMPGWDEWYRETTFKFALHGYVTITPNLYFRSGHGTPEDMAAKVRAGRRTRRSGSRRPVWCDEIPAWTPLHQREGGHLRNLFRREACLSRRLSGFRL